MGVAVSLAACGGGGAGGAADRYFPTSAGATWTYDVAQGSTPSSSQTMINLDGSATSSTRKTTTVASGNYTLSSFDIASGAVVLTESVAHNADDSLVSTTTYSPGTLLVPHDMTVGATASSTSTMALQSATATTATTYTVERTITVDGVETVTVPAGTFSAVKFTATIVTTPSTGTATQTTMVRWHAAGVGMVKEILYPATSPTATTTWTLSSFHIP